MTAHRGRTLVDVLAEHSAKHGMTLCAACNMVVDDEEAHFPHDEDCHAGTCCCDNPVHPECCWACHPKKRGN